MNLTIYGQTFTRSEFGGRWMPVKESANEERRRIEEYNNFLYDRMNKEEARIAANEKRMHESKMKELQTIIDWYKMSEDERKRIGNELFQAPVTPEGGWNRQALVDAGLIAESSLKNKSEQENLFPFIRDVRREPYDPEYGAFVYAPQYQETSTIYNQQARLNPNVTDENVLRFQNLALKEGYAFRNPDLDKFIQEEYQRYQTVQAQSTPEAIQKAKSQQIEIKEQVALRSGREAVRKTPRKSPLQINISEENSQLPQETSVNLPT